ncbi:hypothetical protein E2C01_062589 [Portunus trituberculatus]|uniref:Uncharacterized protein n=1 Tax=Portunus trituberculatus TaxID=210409 RepID=A0A5B7HF34_PORTR|nr:hypothetical protein [Portunus trituberculatus]
MACGGEQGELYQTTNTKDSSGCAETKRFCGAGMQGGGRDGGKKTGSGKRNTHSEKRYRVTKLNIVGGGEEAWTRDAHAI